MDEINGETKHEMCVEACDASVFVIFALQDKSRFFVWLKNFNKHSLSQSQRRGPLGNHSRDSRKYLDTT
jgi:hypothetical protein